MGSASTWWRPHSRQTNSDGGDLEQAANRFTSIHDHLRAKGVEPLVEMIMSIAERDPSLLKDLELAAAMATADDETLFMQFKKVITEATRTHGFIEYRAAHAWVQGVESVLDRMASLIKSGRSKLALQLLDHFFARMDQALDSMDDSDGQGGAVYGKACEVHLAACREAKLDPVALAQELFAREVNSGFDFFHGASETYGDILGNTGLAEYRRLATVAWQEIKPRRAGGRQVHDEEFGIRYSLAAILEGFAERDDDIEAGIAIRAKDLSTARAYLEIARLCFDHDREAEALKWSEEGLWQFEDSPDERLVMFAADLYGRAGRKDDADKLLWQTFEQLPSVGLYRKLKAAAGPEPSAVNAVCQRAFGLLRAKLGKPDAVARWSTPRDILMQLLMSENLLTEAWDVVRNHGGSDPQLDALAQASEKSHPAEVLATFARRVDRLVSLGGQSNYKDADKIIARMRKIRKRLGANAEHAAYVSDLMARHKAKQNFVKLLQATHHA